MFPAVCQWQSADTEAQRQISAARRNKSSHRTKKTCLAIIGVFTDTILSNETVTDRISGLLIRNMWFNAGEFQKQHIYKMGAADFLWAFLGCLVCCHQCQPELNFILSEPKQLWRLRTKRCVVSWSSKTWGKICRCVLVWLGSWCYVGPHECWPTAIL